MRRSSGPAHSIRGRSTPRRRSRCTSARSEEQRQKSWKEGDGPRGEVDGVVPTPRAEREPDTGDGVERDARGNRGNGAAQEDVTNARATLEREPVQDSESHPHADPSHEQPAVSKIRKEQIEAAGA